MQWINRTGQGSCSAAIALAVFIAAPLVADSPPATDATVEKEESAADRIAQLIEQLGSEDFAAREKAQSELAQAGLEAYDALHAAQSNRDPEIALRARYLVLRMRQTVRWFADSDPPKVVAILKEYGDLEEPERRNRIDRLAALENNLGVGPLIRLARFETLDTLAKYAALQVLELPAPEDEAAKSQLLKHITNILGKGKRPAAVWLRLYGRTLSDPLSTLAEWDQATQAEHAALEKTPERTTREIVRDLHRFQVDLLNRLDRQDEANAVIHRTLALIDGTPDQVQKQVQEVVDWLTHRQAWPVALEVMQKFDAAVQEKPALLYRLAGIYDKLQQPQNAEETAKKALALKPENLEDHLVIAHELEDSPGLAKWAEAEYRQVLVNATPGSRQDFAARFRLSELLHDRLQELPAAEVLKPASDLMQKDESAKETWYRATLLGAEAAIARMNYFFACHFHEQGDGAREKEHLKIAVDMHSKDADVLIAMYRLANADDDWKAMTKEKIETVAAEYHREVDEARMLLEAADGEQIRRDATFELARNCNQYAWLVGNTFGDYQEAVKLSQESVKICQQLPELKASYAGFLDTLGRAHFGAGDVPNAVKFQTMAATLSPDSGQIRRQLEFFQKEAHDRGIKLPEPETPVVPKAKPSPPPAAAPTPRPVKELKAPPGFPP